MRRLLICSSTWLLLLIAPAVAGQQVLINIGKHGRMSVDQQHIRQKDLLTTLARLGVASGSKLSVQGDEGVPYKDISKVMETLASAGLLPKGSID